MTHPSELESQLQARHRMSDAQPHREQDVANVRNRFCLLEPLQGGGHRAYDTVLRREVVLRFVELPQDDAQTVAAAISVAQALAMLSHPNVVAVYDVIMEGARAMLALEAVRGQTLKAWLASQAGRPWPDVLRAFLQAGQGLAATHRVGLVHGSFGADKVLVADDGRVIVTDFGGASQPQRAVDTSATNDQVAFCLALWEALTGVSPSAGPAASTRPVWPSAVRMPSRIIAALQRGLAPDPEARWPDMDTLLSALAYDPGLRRRRWLTAAALLPALALAGGWSWAWRSAQAKVCAGAEEHIGLVWNDDRREQVTQAFAQTGLPYADEADAKVRAVVDGYSRAWAEHHREACEATAVRGEQPQSVMDLRMACLHRRKIALRAAADVLVRADAQVVEKAAHLVAGLPGLPRCADVQALQAEVPPPEDFDAARAVARAREILADAVALEHAGKYDAAMMKVEAAEVELGDVDYTPARAELALRRGLLLARQGKFAAAEASLEEAMVFALASGSVAEAVEALAGLALDVGYRQARGREGIWLAETAIAVAHGQHRHQEAHARSALAIMSHGQRRLQEAEAQFRHALELYETALGREHQMVATAHNNLGNTLESQGRYAEAEREHRQALALREKLLGKQHPVLAESHGNLGNVLSLSGRHEEAEQELRKALALYQATFGELHPKLAGVRTNLGLALYDAGRYQDAEREQRQAVALYQQLLPQDHPLVGNAHTFLGETLEAQGRFAEAEQEHRTALAIYIKQAGADGPWTAQVLHRLGRVLAQQGLDGEAREYLERAWTVRKDGDVLASERAETAFALAKLLWPRRAERARALELAKLAQAAAKDAGEASGELQREVEGWLAQRDPRVGGRPDATL